MMKLTEIERPKNIFALTYYVCNTNVDEGDNWSLVSKEKIEAVIETEDDLRFFLKCFGIAKKEIDLSRTGYGYPSEDIDFEKYTDEEEFDDPFDKVEILSQEGVSFIKNGKEFFVCVGYDFGMPTEDGHFFQGLKFDSVTYFDNNGVEFLVELD